MYENRIDNADAIDPEIVGMILIGHDTKGEDVLINAINGKIKDEAETYVLSNSDNRNKTIELNAKQNECDHNNARKEFIDKVFASGTDKKENKIHAEIDETIEFIKKFSFRFMVEDESLANSI